MMAPDYAHWHGMFEVAERFYMQLDSAGPRAREAGRGTRPGRRRQAVRKVIDEILARPEHAWFESQLKGKWSAAEKKPANP